MCSIYSVYDELEGIADGMVAYRTCHLCHNGNKKCERPPNGGQCKRCANTYIYRSWALNEEPPSFSDNKTANHVWALLQALSDTSLSLFENPRDYHTLTISLANSFDSDICEPSQVHFFGPLRHDNNYLVQEFDQIIDRILSAPRLEVKKDPQGLVARACLVGGYLSLFFSVDSIDDRSQSPLNPRALVLGLGHFILMRISNIIGDVMSLARAGPMSRNARLSLAALHVIVNRIKLSTSRQERLRPFYDNVRLSMLLKDRIHATEGELRQIFQSDCGLIKDWGAPLKTARKEFKNTAPSFDSLTLTIAVNTLDDYPESSTYPTTLSTPSESEQSPLPISSLPDIDLPGLQFAGLEDNQAFEPEESWISDHTSARSSCSSRASPIAYNNISMEDLLIYGWDAAYSPNLLHVNDQDMLMADPSNESVYNHFDATGNPLSVWELPFNSTQTSVADYHEQVLGSPILWDSDPGNSDVALS